MACDGSETPLRYRACSDNPPNGLREESKPSKKALATNVEANNSARS